MRSRGGGYRQRGRDLMNGRLKSNKERIRYRIFWGRVNLKHQVNLERIQEIRVSDNRPNLQQGKGKQQQELVLQV